MEQDFIPSLTRLTLLLHQSAAAIKHASDFLEKEKAEFINQK